VNGAAEAVVCPKPTKGLLSEGWVSLVNRLGLADVPKTKEGGGGAEFDWSPKTGPGARVPNENAPPPRAGLDSPGLPFAVDCCTSRVGLSSIRTSWSSCFGGVVGLSVGAIVTGVPNDEKGLVVTPFTLPPWPLKENVTGVGARGPEGGAEESLKPNGSVFLLSAGGGVLGAAPNENGALTCFWSLLSVFDVFPNENPFAEKRGLTAVEASVVPPNKGFGGSLEVVTDAAGFPKVNSEGGACLGASVGGACDVDSVTSLNEDIALEISPPKSVDGAVWGTLGNENTGDGVSNSECSTATSSGFLAGTSDSETGTLDTCEEGIVADAEISKASGLVISAVSLLVPRKPLDEEDEEDPTDNLTPSLLSFSPSHNGFSASFTGALGVGLWERSIQDGVFEVAGTKEGGNVNVGGPGSGFVITNELAKKFGTPLSFTPTFAGLASGAGVESVQESTTGGEVDG
jgi:hypothetical protein